MVNQCLDLERLSDDEEEEGVSETFKDMVREYAAQHSIPVDGNDDANGSHDDHAKYVYDVYLEHSDVGALPILSANPTVGSMYENEIFLLHFSV
jgi:hypothetical protein